MTLQTALITGASAGIGRCYAEALASRGVPELILTARRGDRLQSLAETLHRQHGTRCRILPLDLAAPGATATLMAELGESSVDLLINNAGYGYYGDFLEQPPEDLTRMLQLNVIALTELTRALLPGMLSRGEGRIINIASTAAFQPIPYFSAYSASKAYVLSFSEALWAEYGDRGIRILAVCPGPTQTEFFDVAGMAGNAKLSQSITMERPEDVVQRSLEALERGEASCVTGNWMAQALTRLPRLFPRETLVKAIASQFRPD